MTYANRELADKYQDFFNFMNQEHNLILTIEEMDDILSEAEKLVKRLTIHDVVCCGALERMQLGWMQLEDGTRCMPYIKGHSDENMYRVNNCPSCGKHVRDVMVYPCA